MIDSDKLQQPSEKKLYVLNTETTQPDKVLQVYQEASVEEKKKIFLPLVNR